MFTCYHSVLSLNLSGSFTLVHELHNHNTRNAISNNFVFPSPRTNGLKGAYCIWGQRFGIIFQVLLRNVTAFDPLKICVNVIYQVFPEYHYSGIPYDKVIYVLPVFKSIL